MVIEGWQVNNFFTVFILVMILAFQRRGTRVKTGRMYTYMIICTMVLVIADTFARIGENRGGSFIIMAFLGNLAMFLADPLIVLFSVIYIDCWMDEKNRKPRWQLYHHGISRQSRHVHRGSSDRSLFRDLYRLLDG